MSAGGMSKERLARMQDVMERHVASARIPGLVALVSRRGETHVDAIGTMDFGGSAPIRRDTIFRLASITKPITAAAAMILVEECRLRLDDPVDPWLPELADRKVLRTIESPVDDTVPANRPITLRDLLTFRLGHGAVMVYPERHPIQKTMTEAGVAPGPTLPALPPDELMKRYGSLPLVYQPGEKWLYNSGSDILGVLIARASETSLGAFLRERIFEPLGMKDTGYFVPAEKADRVSKTYVLNEQGVVTPTERQGDPTRKPTYFPGSSGLFSTASDYLRFCQMLISGGELDGKRLLSETTVDFMLRNHLPAEIIPPEGPNGRKGYGFGIGGAVLMDPTASGVLSVAGEFSWGGAAGTYFWVDRKNELAAVWMVQRPPFTHEPGKRFKVLTYQAMEP
jgi:CubicO group peptidase (beta-lactamase class C family)